MNRSLFVFVFLFFTGVSQGQDFQNYKEKFCEISRDRSQSDQIKFLQNRLSFDNAGGFFNGGVCWWHSRLQRSATYLAVFRPDLPKPTQSSTVRALLRKLKYLTQVVEVPGYQNFHEFSAAWPNTFQKFLNRWQAEEGLLYFGWIDGLAGSPRGNSYKLMQTMMKVQSQVIDQKQISFLKLQLKGIEAHAWLVYSAERVADGLKLGIIDSNFMSPIEYVYRWGDASINSTDYGSFMPYLEHSSDLPRMNALTEKYCSTSENLP